MSIADELARERASARRVEQDRRRDVSRARGIDDVDSLDELDMLDWSTDPWDDAVAAGSVERLRWQTRSVKWVAYSLLVLGMVAVLVGRRRRLVVHPPGQPGGRPGTAGRLHVDPADTLETVSERLAAAGLRSTTPGVFRWYVDHHGGLELTPGYYELRTSDHMGNVLARLRTPPARDVHQGDVPRGLHVGADGDAARRDSADHDGGRRASAAAADPHASSPTSARPT